MNKEKLAEEWADREYDELRYEKCERKDFVFTFYELREMGKEAFLAGLNSQTQWHKQSEDDIFDAVNDWSSHYFLCRMKDNSYNIALGSCDEDGDGNVTIMLYFKMDDEKYFPDDIVYWQEIELPKVEEK